MRIAFFSTKPYEKPFFEEANQPLGHELVFLEARLLKETVALAHGFPAVCPFVNDQLDRGVLQELASHGTRVIALRSAGFNNVDVPAAQELGLSVVRVPAYSPHAVAEHTLGLMLALNRGIHRASSRVRDGNFSLDGLLGFDLHRKTAGVIGTGQIGAVTANLLLGLGMTVLAYDVKPNPECEETGIRYVELNDLLAQADVVSLHAPLNRETHHLINPGSIPRMKKGVMLINTSRGGLVDTQAVIEGLKSGHIGYLGLDVYEEEADLFFEDQSNRVMQDDVFARLLTFPNVLVTGHQAFFTREALQQIASVTLNNISEVETTSQCKNAVQ